jgi:hypothetical protein
VTIELRTKFNLELEAKVEDIEISVAEAVADCPVGMLKSINDSDLQQADRALRNQLQSRGYYALKDKIELNIILIPNCSGPHLFSITHRVIISISIAGCNTVINQ